MVDAAAAGPAGPVRPARWRTAVRAVALTAIVGSLVWIRALAYRHLDVGDPFFTYASLAPVAYLLPGLALLWRRSWHVVGWLLCALAMLVGFSFSSEVGVVALRAGDAWLLWLLDTAEGPVLWATLAALFAVFPDGLAAQTPWQRRIGRAVLVAGALTVVPGLFATRVAVTDTGAATLPSPLPGAFLPRAATEDVPLLVVWVVVLVALTGLVLRYRATHAALRRQYRWVLWALGALVPALLIGLIGSQVTDAAWLPMLAAYIAVPIAFMVAILRYRLYEIDRLISRTVAYGLIIVVLAGIYAAATALLALVLPADSDLAVAASTLLVAAAFRPLQRRVRRAVDRRFDRRRFDAVLEVERFARHVRDQPDVAAVRAQLRAVVVDTMAPETVDVWVARE